MKCHFCAFLNSDQNLLPAGMLTKSQIAVSFGCIGVSHHHETVCDLQIPQRGVKKSMVG